LDHAQVDALLDKTVAELLAMMTLGHNSQQPPTNGQQQMKPSLAKLLLHLHGWDMEPVKIAYQTDAKRFLIEVFGCKGIFCLFANKYFPRITFYPIEHSCAGVGAAKIP
jgi:hypothetical protein